jgi:kynureninase
MPRGVPDRLAEYVDAWAELGVRAWGSGWWEMPVTVGDGIAPLIGAGPGEVAMVPNVSLAHAAVVSALEYSPGRDTIVMTALDFPSVRYTVEALGERLGARVVVVPSDDGVGIAEDRLLAAIDDRTRLVAISHVLFRSAYVIDAMAVCRRAHEMGAVVALDAFHSVGVIPVDVRALGVDFLIGGVLKWLCGGPGACFLFASPSARDRFAPALTGWQAHARPFAFEETMEHTTGAFRWLSGTPAIPALYAASEGPRLVARAGVRQIRAKSLHQTELLIALADERGYAVRAPRDASRRGGTVAIDVPHAEEVSRDLLSRDILVDYRPNAGIRIAPHFYTADAEIASAIDAIADSLRTDRWRDFATRASAVT